MSLWKLSGTLEHCTVHELPRSLSVPTEMASPTESPAAASTQILNRIRFLDCKALSYKMLDYTIPWHPTEYPSELVMDSDRANASWYMP